MAWAAVPLMVVFAAGLPAELLVDRFVAGAFWTGRPLPLLGDPSWAELQRTLTLAQEQLAAVLAVSLVVLGLALAHRARGLSSLNRAAELLVETEVLGVAFRAELRNHETAQHQGRITQYVELLAASLGLSPGNLWDLVRAAPLYNIGIGTIPDRILLKPGPLTPEERLVMETHCFQGDQILAPLEARLGHRCFLTTARQIALGHHEKWNGTGYPGHLAGHSIPLVARILALADVYDALRSCRPYKDAQSHEKCVETIQSLSGSHFDPKVVEAFHKVAPEFDRLSTISGWMDSY